jgi:SecD/SecF fusion protein
MQRVPIGKIIFIVITLLISLYVLMPSIQFYSYDLSVRNSGNTPEIDSLNQEIEKLEADKEAPGADTAELNKQLLTKREEVRLLKKDFHDIRGNSIRQGMDLQGGVHLVIEVDQEEFEKRIRDDGAQQEKTEDEIEEDIEQSKATVLDSVIANIDSRINQYGVSETALVKQPPWRIVLEMPGIDDPEQVRQLVQADANLSFQLVAKQNKFTEIIGDIDTVIAEDFPELIPNYSYGIAAGMVQYPDNVEMVKAIIERPAVRSLIPNDLELRWSPVQPATDHTPYEYQFLYLLQRSTRLTGEHLKDAGVIFDPMTNRPEVRLVFKSTGRGIFSSITTQNVGENLAVVLNGLVFTAPTIQERITQGVATITGIDDYEEAKQIAVVLRAGALPAPLEVAESRVVGPSLGQDSIQAGLRAGMIGAAIVLIFMVVYYALVGVVADIAVVLNLFFLMAGMAMFKATLTLPGIAGIVLTIGMAVDANVLIFERLREEVKGKRAKTVALVLEKGYGRAFMTIFDANLTTLITALVLFQFGTGPIKGFAVTLSLGILISMFTAVFVSRVILDTLVANGMKSLSLGSFRLFENPKFDFFRSPKSAMSVSGGLAILGFVFLIANWGNLQGIDFAGGNEILVEYQQPVDPQTVRDSLAKQGISDPVIQSVLGEENQIMVRVRQDVVENTEMLVSKMQAAMPDQTFEVLTSGSVGSKVGSELLLKGLYCLIFSSIGILLYITARFEFRFALAAVITLFHDLLFTLGLLAVSQTQFNLPIIAALLTVLGYSLNDTIVVFDRIRENYSSAILNFREIVNLSINQTLSRTVNTSMTTLFVVGTLYFFGGSVIHDFALTLMIGVVIGTYSSIFVASPLLLMIGQKHLAEQAKTDKSRHHQAPA